MNFVHHAEHKRKTPPTPTAAALQPRRHHQEPIGFQTGGATATGVDTSPQNSIGRRHNAKRLDTDDRADEETPTCFCMRRPWPRPKRCDSHLCGVWVGCRVSPLWCVWASWSGGQAELMWPLRACSLLGLVRLADTRSWSPRKPACLAQGRPRQQRRPGQRVCRQTWTG